MKQKSSLKIYKITDQGSTRITFDAAGNVVQTGSFYPFGMEIPDFKQVLSGTGHPYLFNSKEWVADAMLDMYDYGWRMYDPSIGRWHAPDPMDQYWGPYLFCGNTILESTSN